MVHNPNICLQAMVIKQKNHMSTGKYSCSVISDSLCIVLLIHLGFSYTSLSIFFFLVRLAIHNCFYLYNVQSIYFQDISVGLFFKYTLLK